MKKFLSLILILVLVCSTAVLPCNAAQEDTEIVYLENGDYLVITTTVYPIARSNNTVGGNRSVARHSDGVLQWTFTLTAIFRYEPGVEVECTSATCSYSISNSAWSCTSKSATPNGASATANATMVRKVLLVTVETVPASVTLACDTYGNLT